MAPHRARGNPRAISACLPSTPRSVSHHLAVAQSHITVACRAIAYSVSFLIWRSIDLRSRLHKGIIVST
jgi:hypothetical protein